MTGNVLTNDDLGNPLTKVTAYDALTAQGGSVIIAPDGNFTYNPAPDFFGQDTFTYTITDLDGDVSTATVTVDVNANPDAVDDVFAGDEDQMVMGNVLVNDDLGNPLTEVTAYDAITTENGSVVIEPDGNFTYTPKENFSGADTFTYTITDADGDQSTATVTINVEAQTDVIFIGVDPNALASAAGIDQQLITRLENLTIPGQGNVDVQRFYDNQVQDSDINSLGQEDLIIVSESTRVDVPAELSKEVIEELKITEAGVMTWENVLYDDLGMTGVNTEDVKHHGTEGGYEIDVNGAPIEVYQDPANRPQISWGLVSENDATYDVDVRATLPGEPDKATIFAYEQGAVMAGVGNPEAPGKRLGFFLHNQRINSNNLTQDALELFDDSVEYMLG